MVKCPKCQHDCSDEAQFCGNCATPLKPADKDSFIGRCIDNKYYITKRIASGGMGEIYLAHQKGVGQDVAIKKLHAECYQDKDIVSRFIDEARSYGRITHPNAVKLHDLLNVNGQICIIMEYVDGKTLTHYIENKYPFTIRQIIDISLQIADALGTVHRAGIIHRDLKTENVMLLQTVPGRFSVKILDFGIAKMLDKPVDRKTKEGIIVGTPEFMSPEQCYGMEVDTRTDIYAFGILMFVMICGHLPFECDSAMGLLQMQISSPIPPMVRPNGEDVPAGLAAIVSRCMQKSPDDRYDSFGEVITDLTCLQEGKNTQIANSHIEPVIDVDLSSLHDETAPESSQDENRAKTAQPHHSEAFSFVIDDEADGALLTESSQDDEEENNGGYSLGDIHGLDGSLSDLETVQKTNRSGKGWLIAAVIILLAAIGITYIMRDTLGITFYDSLLHPNDTPLQAENGPSKPDVQNIRTAVEDNANSAVDIKKAEQPPVVEPVRQLEPISPSQVASRDVLMRGIGRAAMQAAREINNNGDIDKAKELINTINKSVLSESDNENLKSIELQIAAFDDILKQVEKAKRHENCSQITELSQSVPPEAQGFKDVLDKSAQKCKAYMANAPTTL